VGRGRGEKGREGGGGGGRGEERVQILGSHLRWVKWFLNRCEGSFRNEVSMNSLIFFKKNKFNKNLI
jgi:hypothetical protein